MSLASVNLGEGLDAVGSNVLAVRILQGRLVARLDRREDGVGLANGILLLALVLGVGVRARVEENESVLLGNNRLHVTRVHRLFQVGNASTILGTSAVNGGLGYGTIGKGKLGKTRDGRRTNGNLAKGGTAVDRVKGRAGSL